MKEPITDSPWFWFSLFTAVGLAALLATGGHLGKRQANIENKYQARSAVATGQVQVETEASGERHAVAAPHYSSAEEHVIPIWPVEIILGLIFVGSLTMLLRQQFGGREGEAPAEP